MSDDGKIREVASLVGRFVRKIFPGRESAEVDVERFELGMGDAPYFELWTKGRDSMVCGVGSDTEQLKRSVLRNFRYRLGPERSPQSWEELEMYVESLGGGDRESTTA